MAYPNQIVLVLLSLSFWDPSMSHSRSARFGDDSRPDLWTGDEKTTVLLRCNLAIHRHPVLMARWNNNSTHFWIQLTGETSGWMGFGISPDGEMQGSDILFGWCDDTTGKCFAQDRLINVDLAQQRVNLTNDRIQDWKLISGRENGTHTVITAARRLVTNDPADRPFAERIIGIHSLGQFDPDITTGEITKHTYRGSSRLNVLNPNLLNANGNEQGANGRSDENADYEENSVDSSNVVNGIGSMSSSFGRGNAWRTSSGSSSSLAASWISRNSSRGSSAASQFVNVRVPSSFIPRPQQTPETSTVWESQSNTQDAYSAVGQEANQVDLGSWSSDTTTEALETVNEINVQPGKEHTGFQVDGSWGTGLTDTGPTSVSGRGFLKAIADLIGLARWFSTLAVNGSLVVSSSQSVVTTTISNNRHRL